MIDLRARTGVGHGQQSRLGVLQLEVLVGKLLAVDGLATGTLCNRQYISISFFQKLENGS